MCAYHTWLKCRQGSGIASHKTFSAPSPRHLHDVARACVWLSSDVLFFVLFTLLPFLYDLINDPFSNAVSKPGRNTAERWLRTYCARCTSYSWCIVTNNFTHSISAKNNFRFSRLRMKCFFEFIQTVILVICCRFHFLWINWCRNLKHVTSMAYRLPRKMTGREKAKIFLCCVPARVNLTPQRSARTWTIASKTSAASMVIALICPIPLEIIPFITVRAPVILDL